jgi:alkanesulfonate monooxygenase SsuD/methylene tetrahydromethanopterin reductase-like flavin-dependent oxidoreductase (luciferase family)
MTTLDIQVNAAHCDWLELRETSLAAEHLGFGALWVFDHLAGAALAGDRMLECFTLLGALAATTHTIELGVLVANVWNRQVGTLVSAAASVALLSGRQFHLGIGAGTSPGSKWAVEQHAVAAELADTIEARHARVEQVLDLTDREWAPDREPAFATFPLPSPVPTRIIGVNSVRLSEIAGRRADGINVAWHHPRRDEFLAAAEAAAAGRPLLRTVWMRYDDTLLDADHPVRIECEATRIDRLVLIVTGRPASWG